MLFAVLVKDDHVLGEVGVEPDLDPQTFACIVDNDLLDEHPEIDVADLAFLDDFLNQVNGALHFRLALFDGFAVVFQLIDFILELFNVALAGGEHFIIDFCVLPVADTLEQNLLLVGFALFKRIVELTELAGDGALFLQPFAHLAIDILIDPLGLLADVFDLAVDDLVELFLVYAVRAAVILAVAVVAVADVFYPNLAVPLSIDGAERRSAVAALQQSGVAVIGLVITGADVHLFLLLHQPLHLLKLFL